MTTTRKTFVLGMGLVLTIGSNVLASERERGTGSDAIGREEAAPVVSPSDIRVVGPGAAVVTIGGAELKLYANNQVLADEVEASYGSLERHQFESMVARQPKSVDPTTGAAIYASNTVGYFSDLLGDGPDVQKPAPTTAEEFKNQYAWTEALIGGQTVLLFVNNMVVADDDHVAASPEWVRYASHVPNRVTDKGERVYVTNAVFPEPVIESKDGQ